MGGSSGKLTSDSGCGMCQASQQNPKLLPCLHSFCRNCIQTHITSKTSGGSFQCPLCLKSIATPENMAAGLEDNIYLATETMKAKSPNSFICEVCEVVKASSSCLECKKRFCTACTKAHAKMRFEKEHTITSLDFDDKFDKHLELEAFCERHPSNVLACFCFECQEMICSVCNMTTHKHHHSKGIEETANDKRKEILEIVEDDIETKTVPRLETWITSMKEEKEKYEEMKTKQRELIEGHVLALKQQLDKKAKDMSDQVETTVNARIGDIDKEIAAWKTTLNINTMAGCTARQMMTGASNSDLLKRFKNVKSALYEHMDHAKQRPARKEEDIEITYSPGKVSDETIDEMLGHFSTKLAGPVNYHPFKNSSWDQEAASPLKADDPQHVKRDVCTGSDDADPNVRPNQYMKPK